jgi:hypothetical protein
MPLPKSGLSLAEQEILLKTARSELREEQMLQARPDVPAWRKNLAAQFRSVTAGRGETAQEVVGVLPQAA